MVKKNDKDFLQDKPQAKTIAVVGGVGSYAGLDLIKKIYDNTFSYMDVKTDQDYLPVVMLSLPQTILDRSEFLQGKTTENPGYAIANIISQMASIGGEVAGIPCNTAHSSAIFSVVKNNIPAQVRLLNMIEEVARYFYENHSAIKRIGILATNGTNLSQVYSHALKDYDIETIYPAQELQSLVHNAIYDIDYGIKAHSNPVTEKARNDLLFAANHLIDKGAQGIILGCTEIPLAIQKKQFNDIPVVDATKVLATALIRASLGLENI